MYLKMFPFGSGVRRVGTSEILMLLSHLASTELVLAFVFEILKVLLFWPRLLATLVIILLMLEKPWDYILPCSGLVICNLTTLILKQIPSLLVMSSILHETTALNLDALFLPVVL